MGKYDPLYQHLSSATASHLRLSFVEIERILRASLPMSARRHQAWWENERDGSHVHARAWLDAGYETHRLDLNSGTVEFVQSPRSGGGR